jgi:glyoxylase-like metal-dependent hydrolase (beta-lactamase superfamily II)
MGAADTVRQAVSEHRLKPRAIFATHGHIDHVADAAVLADEFGVPLWIHSLDREMLTDPLAGLNMTKAELGHIGVAGPFAEPKLLNFWDDVAEVAIAGLTFSAVHAPGHTEGCVLLATPYVQDDITEVVFSGDVLFAGSIGRTDLPGGDPAKMEASLAGPVWDIPDTAVVLPGHGPQTLMRIERTTNPYLRK